MADGSAGARPTLAPLLADARLPRLAPVRQRLSVERLDDPAAEAARAFRSAAGGVIRPGERVALAVGSRGVATLAPVVAAVVSELRALGAEPFVVPAMGSHGGATAEGQRTVLAGYGVTEAAVGCPFVSSMDTVLLGATAEGVPVYADRAAAGADAVVLLNRVKPHSSLTGDQGSGLMKMAAVGLGNRRGAETVHAAGLAAHLAPVARVALARLPVRLGVALVENGLDETHTVEVVSAAGIEEADRRLLRQARALLPRIPIDPIDVLVVDRIGKEISGTGMDPNVIGMHRRKGGAPDRTIRRIVALDLTEASHGNANGVGMADIVTERLRAKIDWDATYTNALTGDFLHGAKLPLVAPTARDAVALACRPWAPEAIRLVRVADTAHLETLWVSGALLGELDRYGGVERAGAPEEMRLA